MLNHLDDQTAIEPSSRHQVYVETTGEFAGWRTWRGDGFGTLSGPFWQRTEEDGGVRCAFRVEQKHLNTQSNVHGGCFMTFADYCLFATAAPLIRGPAVTVSFACEFLEAAREGDLVECKGEIMRAGGSLVFVRGLLKCAERPLFSFSGTLKRVKKPTSVVANTEAK